MVTISEQKINENELDSNNLFHYYDWEHSCEFHPSMEKSHLYCHLKSVPNNKHHLICSTSSVKWKNWKLFLLFLKGCWISYSTERSHIVDIIVLIRTRRDCCAPLLVVMSVQNVGTSQRHATLSEDHATIGGKIRRHARCVNSYPPIFIYSFSIFISLMCIRDFVDILTRFIGFSQNRSHSPGKAASTPSRPQHFLDVAPEPLGFEI